MFMFETPVDPLLPTLHYSIKQLWTRAGSIIVFYDVCAIDSLLAILSREVLYLPYASCLMDGREREIWIKCM